MNKKTTCKHGYLRRLILLALQMSIVALIALSNTSIAHHSTPLHTFDVTGNGTHFKERMGTYDSLEEARQACHEYRTAHNEESVTHCGGSSTPSIGAFFSTGWDLWPPEQPHAFYLGIFPYHNSDQGKQCQNEGASVNLGSGNEFHTEDLVIGDGLDLRLSYNSNIRTKGDDSVLDINNIAAGWTMSMNMYISPVLSNHGYDEYVVVHRGDGRYIRFVKVNNEWESSVKDKQTLEKTISGWRFMGEKGSIELYNNNGQLISFELDNRVQTISYSGDFINKITNEYGNFIQFSHSGAGSNFGSRYTSVTDHAGRQWTFGYTDDNLTSINYPDNTHKTFNYTDSRYPYALTEIIDRNGKSFIYQYDTQGRVKHEEYVGGINAITIDYIGTQRRITNSLGDISIYHVSRHNGMWKVDGVDGPGCNSCNNSNTINTYDAENNIQQESIDGNITQYGNFDSKGQYGYKIEAFGTLEQKRTEYTYDPRFFNKPLTIIEPSVSHSPGANKVTSLSYDEHANITRMEVTGYEPDGQPVSAITVYHYDGPFNQISHIDGPRADVSDVTTYEYYPLNYPVANNRGRLKRMTNASGIVVRDNINYSSTGQVLSEDESNGLSIHYTYYPGNDRLETTTYTDGNKAITTHLSYLSSGETKTITRRHNTIQANTTTFDYDAANRLIQITDQQGNHMKYTLDTEGNQLSEKTYDPSGLLNKTINQLFDEYSNLESISQSGVTEYLSYGSDGLLYEFTNGNQVKTSNDYDALNRLVKITQGIHPNNPRTVTNNETIFSYDIHNNINAIVDANGNKTSYFYDDIGRIVKHASPDTGTDVLSYDAAGNIISKSDANGDTTLFAYDADNRVTSINYPGVALDVGFNYDQNVNGENQLSAFSDSKSTTTFDYDTFGNLINKSQLVTDVIAGYDVSSDLTYQYDSFNRLASITYPSAQVITYHYNRLDQVIRISTTVNGQTMDLINQAEYLPMGPLKSMDLGNGLRFDSSYDSGYRLTSLNYGTTLYRIFEYDGNRNIITTRSEIGGKERFSYDPLDRLLEESTGPQKYTYDKLGNRTSSTLGRQPVVVYNYESGSNQLMSVDGSQRSYDNNGNTLVISAENKTSSYDKANRLAQVEVAGIVKGQYHYNAVGQRIHKKKFESNGSLNADFVYLYNRQGQLVHESRHKNNTRIWDRETIWLNNQPIAQIRTTYTTTASPETQVYYILSDHLNTPKKVTDDSGTVLWSWHSDAFGNTAADSDVDGDGQNFAFHLRFPGQFFDNESEQHYNYYRDYEPGTGRYLQSDPIGLNGDSNSYLYTNANPLSRTDRLGLFSIKGCDDDCGRENLLNSAKEWCSYVKATNSIIRDVGVRNCVIKRCRRGTVNCENPCRVKVNCAGKPTRYRGRYNKTDGVVICLNEKPTEGGWGSTVVHEFAHSCGWGHGDGAGVPNDPGKTPSCERT